MVSGIDYSFKKHFIAVKFTPVIGDKCYNLLNIKNKSICNAPNISYSFSWLNFKIPKETTSGNIRYVTNRVIETKLQS